mmetsp:Transcript_2132/g.6159  ORF Transcript_2132/g.6159 Transcript_2132/m.6159 type:complete len:452 (-) Transcript_2132:51-1406(-)
MASFKSFYAEHCIYLPAMLGWFFFSALISTYNKYIFGEKHMAFPCPLLFTSIHFLLQWVVSYTLSSVWPAFFGGDQVKAMTWKQFLAISIPCGLVTSGDVGLSNLALVRISLTFYTMVKASAPVFVVASAYIFGIEKITFTLIMVVLVISAGEFLTVWGEAEFELVGFLLCLGASVVTGMRWTVIQLKIQSLQPPLKSTIATMRILSPSMFCTMFVTSLALEQPWDKFQGTHYFDTPWDSLKTIGMALFGGFLAISMVMCEFWLIMKANAIVLMIGGVIKEMITIGVGVWVFGDVLNGINLAGFCVVFSGVLLYKVSHFLSKLEAKAEGLVDDDLSNVGGGKNVNYAHVGDSSPDNRANGGTITEHSDSLFSISDDDFEDELSNGVGDVEVEVLGTGGDFDNTRRRRPMEISNGNKKTNRIGALIRAARGEKEQWTEGEDGEFKDPEQRIV